MIVAGLVGLIVGIAGIIYAPQAINNVGTTLDENLTVIALTLDTTEDTLLLAQTTLGQVDAGLGTVANAVVGISGALRETTPLLDAVGKIVSEDVPNSLDSLQSVVPELSRAAGVVEDALTALSEFRLEQTILGINLGFDLGFDYDPEQSMSDSIDGLGTSLDGMSPRLRTLQTFLDSASGDIETIGQDIEQVSDTIETLSGQLESAATLLDTFLATINELQRTIEGMRDALPQQLQIARIAVIVFMVWIGLAQLAPLYLGWELVSEQRERQHGDE
jgi:methyl-accepting chemotaxis protein